MLSIGICAEFARPFIDSHRFVLRSDSGNSRASVSSVSSIRPPGKIGLYHFVVNVAIWSHDKDHVPLNGQHLSQKRRMMEDTKLLVSFDEAQMIEQIIGPKHLNA